MLAAALQDEAFKPIPIHLNSSLSSRAAFAARQLVDLQLCTVWKFLRPRFRELSGSMLDVGCGDMPFRSLLPAGVSYTGIDVTQASDFQMRGSDDVVVFDGTSIPFPDASFDTVLCTEVLEHNPSPVSLVAEMLRVLKPGGQLIATVPFSARVHYAPYDFHRFTPFALAAMLESFADVHIEPRGNDIAVIANKLIVTAVRMIRPTRWSIVHWLLLPLLLPVTLAFLALAHVAIRFKLGSQDDPLGYALVAQKPITPAALSG